MFWHNFKYNFLLLFRNKMLIFWTFAFPIILGTFFSMAFSNIENNENLDVIDIAVVDNENFKRDKVMSNTLAYLSEEANEDRLFETVYTTLENAKELLETKKVVGYLKLTENDTSIVIKENGIKETIFKYVVDEILETKKIANDLILTEGANLGNITVDYEELYEKINKGNFIEDTSPNNLSYTMIEFYTLIAMTCLYGGTIGMYAMNNTLANMSRKGSRVAISPVKKITSLLSSTLAAFLVQLIGISLLFFYTIFVLNVDYGSNIFQVILTGIVGSLAGLTMGITVATLFKTNENTKIGIIISITMLCSFLSGMMGITMKYIVDKYVPILNMINPANMITDGLYSLYYYDTINRFYSNIIGLLIFSSIMLFLSFKELRRQKYDSI